MSVVVTTANWRTDYCPRCGVGSHREHSPVTWHSEWRGMCARGHFVALVIDPATTLLVEIFADTTKFHEGMEAAK